MIVVWLIVAALVLVAFEVILPGGILGIFAGLCVIGATVFAGMQFGVLAALGVFVGSLLAIGLLVVVEFKLLAKTRFGRGFFLAECVDGQTNAEVADADIVGKVGVARTRLNPSGQVAIRGKHYDAVSQDGYLEPGQSVRVIAKDSFQLIIQKS